MLSRKSLRALQLLSCSKDPFAELFRTTLPAVWSLKFVIRVGLSLEHCPAITGDRSL